jgi:RNA-directed DNA polymerase
MEAYQQSVVENKSQYRSSIIYKWGNVNEFLSLFFVNSHLPLGLTASPFLSNLFLDFFDSRFVKRFPKLAYTRYSDDMLISSAERFDSHDVTDFISKELSYLNLEINKNKVREHALLKSGDHVKFLGLNIVYCNKANYITVGKKYIRLVSKSISNYISGDRSIDRATIKGQVAYIKAVSKDDYNRLTKLYKFKTNQTIDRFLK